MADRKTIILSSDGSEVIIAKPQLGFNPADNLRQFQVSVKGLDGGTYGVDFVPAGTGHRITFVEGLSETAAALSAGDSFLYDVLYVTFDSLGAAAAPEVAATFWVKGL